LYVFSVEEKHTDRKILCKPKCLKESPLRSRVPAAARAKVKSGPKSESEKFNLSLPLKLK
jgi:hypothetical protein